MKKRHRIFIAVNLPGDVKKYLYGFNQKWRDLPARWTSLENLHITLVFLGYLTDIQLGKTCLSVKEVIGAHSPFALTLNRIIYGPKDKKSLYPRIKIGDMSLKNGHGYSNRYGLGARMIWAEGEKSKELSILKKDLEESLSESIEFKPEARLFNPHITLARLNMMEFRAIDPLERPEVSETIDLNFEVESIEVMESKLRRAGPEYSIIESFSFG